MGIISTARRGGKSTRLRQWLEAMMTDGSIDPIIAKLAIIGADAVAGSAHSLKSVAYESSFGVYVMRFRIASSKPGGQLIGAISLTPELAAGFAPEAADAFKQHIMDTLNESVKNHGSGGAGAVY